MTDKFFDFIANHEGQDTDSLRLALHDKQLDFDLDFALLQIECRRKTQRKLPRILQNPRFLFPDSLSAEQASAEALGKFHASLICPGTSILDMTAGLGIDSFYLSDVAKEAVVIEQDPLKAKILSHNIEILGKNNLTVIEGDSVAWLKETQRNFDIIFVDPARRDSSLKRVYGLKDCSPDIIEIQDFLLKKADRVLIKASPMLDVSRTLCDFPSISSVYAVGTKWECKEILIELKANNPASSKTLKAINLDNDGNIVSEFQSMIKPNVPTEFNCVEYLSINDLKQGIFILEPSPMMMKISPWNEVCKTFKAKKFDISSNLFLSAECPENFPGRVTRLDKILTKKDRKSLVGLPVSIVSRNFPESAQDLRKNLKVKEGDENFIYASRIESRPIMLLAQKVQNL